MDRIATNGPSDMRKATIQMCLCMQAVWLWYFEGGSVDNSVPMDDLLDQWRLIRLHDCPSWTESSLAACQKRCFLSSHLSTCTCTWSEVTSVSTGWKRNEVKYLSLFTWKLKNGKHISYINIIGQQSISNKRK